MPRITPPERRDAILAAARAEFAARGYSGARLEDVAARVGISKAALYLQFADKAALFRALIDWLCETTLPAELPPQLQGEPPLVQLRALVRTATARLHDGDIAFLPRLVIGESGNFPEIARTYHDHAVRRILGLFRDIIARGVASGAFRSVDSDLAARSVAGGLVLAALWRTVLEPVGADPLDLAAFAESHLDTILHGLVSGDVA